MTVLALPAARTPDPRIAPSLRWGVLGTGWIADKFVTALQKHSSQRIAAIGSRSLDSATEFARRCGIERAHGSYEELTSDPDVDVVYIATPHNAHLPHALLALQSGKHTVVEKPLALNAIQGQRIADEARSRGLFCMEAYWTAFCQNSMSCVNFLAPTLWAMSLRWSLTSASGSPPATAFTGRSWRADRCLISGLI